MTLIFNRADSGMRRAAFVSVVCLGAAAVPAAAQNLNSSGDGSGTDNPDLMGPANACAQACSAPSAEEPIALYGPPPVIDQGDRLVPASDLSAVALDPSMAGIDGYPYEADAPWFETDWSIRLRGSYIEGTGGMDAQVSVEPQFSLVHVSRGGAFTLDTSAELIVDRDDTPRLAAVDVSVSQTLALDAQSNLSASGDLSLSQQSLTAPEVGSDVVATPVELEGAVSVGVDRQFGQLGLEATGDVTRYLSSDTQLVGGPESNVDQQYWNAGGTLRAGYAVTPILTPFVEAGAHFTAYDAAPGSTGVLLNNWNYALSAGLAANWQDVFTAEASVGLGLRRFTDASVGEMSSAIYALDLTYAPDETVAVSANLSTELDPGDPDSGAPRAVTYAASADLSHTLNSWLTLRGSIGGDLTLPESGAARTLNVGGGVGADVALTDNTSLTLDYAYDESRTEALAPERAHEFSLGVMFSR